MIPLKKDNQSLGKKNLNNLKYFKKENDIYDTNKYGITKLNNKINDNPFNIILVDKKSENKKYAKKPSFLNISSSDANQEILGYKETKSENIDESCEQLHNRMTGLFFTKNIFKKINEEENKKCINNNSLILKTTNQSINLNNYYINGKNKDDNKSNNINTQTRLENNNNSSLTYIPNGNEDIKININDERQKNDNISDISLKENININNLVKEKKDNNDIKFNKNDNDETFKYKLRVSRSFSSFPNINLEKDNKSEINSEKQYKRKKSIISQDIANYNKENIFGSFNEVLKSMDSQKNKEYNFAKKENKRYKNIDEIKEDKNNFKFLYLSSNLIEIIKKKRKYQLAGEENNKKSSISDFSNKNYYIYTNDRNVLKLTALYFQKVKKAIFLFNTEKFEESYNSLIEDKIISDKKNFALFLLIIQGIDKDKLYSFLSKKVGINKNLVISKLYLSFFNFKEKL